MAKSLTIRQDRVNSSDQNWTLKYKDFDCKITNYSAFGVACTSPTDFQEDIWENCIIVQNSLFKLEDLKFKVVRKIKLENQFEYGLETLSEVLPVSTMRNIVSVSQFVGDLSKSIEQSAIEVPSNVKLIVYEFKSALQSVEAFLSKSEKGNSFGNFSEKNTFESNTIRIMGQWLCEMLANYNLELNDLTNGLPPEKLKACLTFYRENLREYLYQSIFADRSLAKPLGYAGDYEMMNLLYRNEDFGNSLFARCIEYAVQKHPEPQAVRNRAEYLYGKMKLQLERNPTSTIATVAAGPAYEIQLLVERAPSLLKSAKFLLIDQDLAALKNAQLNIKSAAKAKGVNIDIDLMDTSIKKIIAVGLQGRTFDLLYSAGLFDYFTDEVARLAAGKLVDAIKPGGRVIIGNFNINTPNKFGMKIVFDWDLVYRSADQLLTLYKFNGVKSSIEHEENKINLFCVLEKS